MEKSDFSKKIETPELHIIQPPPALKYTFSLISNDNDLYVCLVITCQRKGGVCKFIAQPLLVIIRTIRFLSTIDPVLLTNAEVNPETILHFFSSKIYKSEVQISEIIHWGQVKNIMINLVNRFIFHKALVLVHFCT